MSLNREVFSTPLAQIPDRFTTFCVTDYVFSRATPWTLVFFVISHTPSNLIEASGARRYENSPAFRPREWAQSFLTKCVAF